MSTSSHEQHKFLVPRGIDGWKLITIPLAVSIGLALALYAATHAYVIRQAERNIENLLLSHKGMHHYIQLVTIPALEQHKLAGRIPADFYAPELFSSSYIVRNQHKFYNAERVKQGLPPISYKLAAKNPRNPENRANAKEEQLIVRFNGDRKLTHYNEIVQEAGGRKFLYVAMPFLENQKQCLRCHGRPENAPHRLLDLYPKLGGFNEKTGEIRAIVSITAPINEELGFIDIAGLALLGGGASLFILWVYNRNMRWQMLRQASSLEEEIRARCTAENEVVANERRFAKFLESTRSVPWELDLVSGRFTYVGKQIEDILGYPAESWTDMNTWVNRLHPDDREQAVSYCQTQTAQGVDHDFTYRVLHSDGSTRWLRDVVTVISGTQGPERLVGFMVDVTNQMKEAQARKQLETKLRQAQKMEAIGTLAGGIAHDFNNMLGAILGYSELVFQKMPAGSEEQGDLQEVITATMRAKELTKQILTFSRQTRHDIRPLNPSSVIKEAVKLLRSTIPTTIAIKSEITAIDAYILADPTQLHQIIMNLCTNAYHAMREAGGILHVQLTGLTLSAETQNDWSAPAGEYLLLAVGDTGCGIPAPVLEKIFDPYYTTKAQGEGTGLGLAVVHAIVEECGGHIAVDSVVGVGTVMRIIFPKLASSNTGEGEKEEVHNFSWLGRERVLLVDDERQLADVLARQLQTVGYQVTTFYDSEAALAAIKEAPQDYDAVVSDVTMPRMNGLQLAQNIFAFRKGMPIILCTGYSEVVDEEKALAMGVGALFYKPVSAQRLMSELRRLCDGSRPVASS